MGFIFIIFFNQMKNQLNYNNKYDLIINIYACIIKSRAELNLHSRMK